MIREFVLLEGFEKQWDDLCLTADDLALLETEILDNPQIGDVIPGTGGLRKMRISLPERGKRGGARVCYVDFTFGEKVYLVTCYGKNEKDNLSKQERNEIKKFITALRRTIK